MRRWGAALVVAVGFALIAAGATFLAYARTGSERVARPTTVASGRWDGAVWRMTAADDARGDWNIDISLGGTPAVGGAGLIYPWRRASAGDSSLGISFLGRSGVPLPDYVIGPVVARATEVDITLSNGATIRTPTIAPPPGLARDIAFYAAQTSCRAALVSVVGIDATGQVVAQLALPRVQQNAVFRRIKDVSC